MTKEERAELEQFRSELAARLAARLTPEAVAAVHKTTEEWGARVRLMTQDERESSLDWIQEASKQFDEIATRLTRKSQDELTGLLFEALEAVPSGATAVKYKMIFFVDRLDTLAHNEGVFVDVDGSRRGDPIRRLIDDANNLYE